MRSQAMFFQARAGQKLADPLLQRNLAKFKDKFVTMRARAVDAYGRDEFEALREAGKNIRQRVLDDLDVWLELFEEKAQSRGATVLWARNGEEICEHVIAIARQHQVKKAVKSKSMLSEEAQLNDALAKAGIQPVETDLGEYILQINGNEAPSHILAPAIHKSLDQVADLFSVVHKTQRKTDIPALAREAREVLREHFLSADMGISGANFLIAETGSAALVTNEGNGRMATTLPRVHVVVTGIEKVIPTLEDYATLMRLLPRSATGQEISCYASLLTGTRGEGEHDGPEHTYFILVDNGRAALAGGEFAPMLRCIRCGACMNHCPVYQSVGGHAYGWVYPGPMGSVLTPLLTGIENAPELPHASTLCKHCASVCPVKIPLADLLRGLREKGFEKHLVPRRMRLGLALWAHLARRPALYALAAKFAVRFLNRLAGGRDRIAALPLAAQWTRGRDFPAPQKTTFRALYARQRAQNHVLPKNPREQK